MHVSAAMETRNSKKPKQEIGVESLHPVTNNDHALGIVRSLRDIPPAHYCLKINTFSFMVNNKIENYESCVFEVGGYKWKLSLYPNGNKKRNVTDHISLYLGIADTKTLPPGWEVNVSFKLFAFDHIRDRYLTIQDGEIQRFHWMKTQWGIDKFLPLDTFNDATNGYLLDDCCVFGTEVFVLKNSGKGECMSLIKDPANNSYTWKIENFSAIKIECLYSPDFVVGDHKWKLLLYPNGSKQSKGKGLSLFLELADSQNLPNERKVYAEFKLRMKNQAYGTWSEHGGIVRSLRDIPPADYCIKINNFSFMVNNKVEDYESGVFEVGGYKWKLSLYPNGNKKRNVTDHISLYLRIADTEALPPGWEVNVSFKLFVFDHIQDKYLTIQDGEIQRFHWMKTQWGFDKFLPLDTFNDVTNGYLLDDCCVFGTEVFVLKYSGKGECISLIKDPANNSYTWKIEKFSAIKDEYLYSPDFVVGDHKCCGSKLTGSCRSGRSTFEGRRSEKRSGEAVKGSLQVLRGPTSVRRWSADANRALASGYEVRRGLFEVKRRSRKVTENRRPWGRGRWSATRLGRDSSVVNGG
ncbi:hypothetical protein RHGRI_032530 [Rhododendron griersonianum]|uniref:MATH domain-containing protein n=1 Tax=Rhododendron griersonianum TaxID=479676 RepID=A0AAV6II06_9ERIC|nr:hypothetical protein RHGRI_032530 [Rhododendron griersonianum]